MSDRTARTRHFLLMHVVENLPPGIDKNKLRPNASQASLDELRILDDIFLLKQARWQASDIFCGAHVELWDDGERYRAWSKLKSAHARKSSHKSDKTQYSVSGRCCHTILFGMLDNTTWFQMENNTLDDFWYHAYDFVEYKLTGRNQGPYGSSQYKDTNPIRIYLNRK